MLDTQTKRRIDDCRDILVGKLPDPKAQIEQITIGLIYKFMDDMDKEAIELGGQAKFFSDYEVPNPEFPNDRNQDKIIEFSKYAWDKLIHPKVTASEMLTLYSEAIEGMEKNPNIPQLFRDIFNNAYLPYRDPETLKLFLKTINEFSYNHSEMLGDAFEYLLSVMGSQGDAGQFRTPRHIIDFVTACVNPQKNETVLDPACGTAGFLLSAYKHILNQNTDSSSALGKKGDKLKPDDRKKLATSFVGYDISPDMVRLSLVNMYLHGFTTPLISEYDTLSSEERWDETFDVILANPPFMTPKGGIRPHKRFGVQANKAEVLFTDYITEHLNSNGRAGIVVPNGIVATSQTAYKQLRKMLVQHSLLAVISLPAGVFQPYSGVKTSILILDKKLVKKSQHILFLKIENDGFDLGAQRREIDKNDLPLALQILEEYKKRLNCDSFHLNDFFDAIVEQNHTNPLITKIKVQTMATLVEKEIILGNKDVVLNPERYLDAKISSSNYPTIKVFESIENITYSHKILKQHFLESGKFPIIDQSENFIAGYWNDKEDVFEIKKPIIIFGDHTRIFKYVDFDFVLGADGVKVLQPIDELNPKYFYYVLNSLEIRNLGYSRHFKELKEIEIPIPPLEIQQQIVAEIEGYQKIIDGAKQIVNNYKPSISINPEWEMVELVFLCTKITDGSHFSPDTVSEGFPYVTVRDVDDSKIDLFDCKKINEKAYLELVKSGCKPEQNDVLFSKDGTVGKVALVDFDADFVVLSSLAIIRPNIDIILPAFLSFILQSDFALKQAINLKGGVAIKRVVLKDLKTIKIPNISISEQAEIVERIEEEQALVNGNKKLIVLFEQKIKNKINEVWGVKEEETFSMVAEPLTAYNK